MPTSSQLLVFDQKMQNMHNFVAVEAIAVPNCVVFLLINLPPFPCQAPMGDSHKSLLLMSYNMKAHCSFWIVWILKTQ